jgi:hypothetical protein
VNYDKNGVSQSAMALGSNSLGSLTLSNLSAGTYDNIVITSGAGCSNSTAYGPILLSDPGAPSTPSVNNNGPICSGGTLTLSSTTVGSPSYNWTGPNGFSSSIQNPVVSNSAIIAMGGSYCLTITVGGCTSAANCTNATINQTPSTPILGSNSPICSGDNINLTSTINNANSYSWSGPVGYSSTLQNPIINNSTVGMNGTYSVYGTNNGCNSTIASLTILVNPTPNPSILAINSPSVCGGVNGNIILNGLVPNISFVVNYDKNGTSQAALSLSSNNNGVVTIPALNAGTYDNIYLSSNSCLNTTPIGPITLSDPSAPIAPSIGSNSPVCSGGVLNLATSTTVGATYNWSGPLGFSSSVQNPTVSTNAISAHSGTYIIYFNRFVIKF